MFTKYLDYVKGDRQRVEKLRNKLRVDSHIDFPVKFPVDPKDFFADIPSNSETYATAATASEASGSSVTST